jgi:hypothetical protein
MVGIAGTFLGIAVGLSGFDSSDLASGVPRLIDGMKVAVWASFTGVCTAIILRLVDTFCQPLDRESAPIAPRGTLDDTPRDVADHSDEVLAELRLMRRDLGERIARVERALDLFPERTAKLLAAELKSRQQQDES